MTPVSLSLPTSDRYVTSSRQVVSAERPFVPRVVYVTSTLVAVFHVVWLFLVALLVWAHKDQLARVKAHVVARLARRPEAPRAEMALAVLPPDAPSPLG